MRSYVQFLTTPTADTPGTCLMLHFDNKRYLIGNIHEGTQRTSIQRGIKLIRVSEVFLTGKTEWKNTGGLIGMILTLAEMTKAAAADQPKGGPLKDRTIENKQRDEATDKLVGVGKNGVEQAKDDRPALTIHGGPNLLHTLATARRFVFRKGMPVHVDEMDGERATEPWQPTWMDQNLKVWAMSISPSSGTGSTPSPRGISWRKRSFDEFEYGEPAMLAGIADRPESPQESAAERKDREQQLRKAVVSEMFDSDWRLDALVETWLEHVKLPATVFVRDPETRKIEKYTGPLPGDSEELPRIRVLVRQPWPATMIQHLPPTSPSQAAMSYIIRNHPQRGKFNPEAAKSLNVEQGPAWNALASGESVRARDGKLVSPDMVLGKGKDGGGVAVVELPSRDYVQNLVERPEWKAPEIMAGVGAVVWLLGPGVGQDENLRKFMSEFSHLKHIVSSQDYCPNYLSLESSASAAIRLNQLDPTRYPIPVHDNVTLPQPGQPALPKRPENGLIPAQRGQTIQLEPSFEVQTHVVVLPLNTAKVLQETPEKVLALAKTAREDLTSDAIGELMAKQDLPSQDAEIITLGTGSALPSKYRNVAATLLRVPGCGSYLLDCGENTLGQLKRVFPPVELAEVLRDLKLIWISHLHADHHLGTASVVKAWYQEVYGKQIADGTLSQRSLTEQLLYQAKILQEEKRLFVASEDSMLEWLREYASVEDFGFNRLVPLSVQAAKPGLPESTVLRWNGRILDFNTYEPKLNRALRASTGLTSLAAVYVDHCRGAMAVTLTFPTGFKFSYSGDCRPSAPFTEIGKDSTVLLHEATFDDELKGDAAAKKHSTTSEALGVGVAMGARRVLLTHFSQRYAKIPVMANVEGIDVVLEDAGQDGMEDMGEVDILDGEVLTERVESGGSADDLLENYQNYIPHSRDRSRSRSKSGNRQGSPKSPLVRQVSTPPRAVLKDMKVGVAFDYMRVKVGEIAHLEKFTPALLKLYEQPDMDEKLGTIAEAEVSAKAFKKAKKDRSEKKPGDQAWEDVMVEKTQGGFEKSKAPVKIKMVKSDYDGIKTNRKPRSVESEARNINESKKG